jgi:molybdopterin converting factor subunit 1
MKILYFAWLRERVGVGEEDLTLPPEIGTVEALVAWLRTRSAGHEAAFSAGRLVRCAVNQDFAAPGAEVSNADEVAFFPPVTGG